MNRLLYFVPAALYMAFIFYLSSIPVLTPPEFGVDPEKIIPHLVEYSILGVLLFFGFNEFSYKKILTIVAGVVGILYGLSDEYHQLFVPNRVFSLVDWGADAAGIVIGLLVMYFLYKQRARRSKNSLSGFLQNPKSKEPENQETEDQEVKNTETPEVKEPEETKE